MQTIAIITSRWNSTRLPGKALADINGHPLLWHVISRVKKSKSVDQVVVATSKDSQPIIDYCKANDIAYYAGSENDILDRLYQTAKKFKAHTVIRVWGDCPCVDGDTIDNALMTMRLHCTLGGECDYFYTYGLPEGKNIAIIPFASFKKAHRKIKNPKDREWLHKYFVDNPDKYKVGTLHFPSDAPEVKLSVDTPEDLKYIRKLYARSLSSV